MVAHDVGPEDWKDEKQQAQIANCGSSKNHQWKALLSQKHVGVDGAFRQEWRPTGEQEIRKVRCIMEKSSKAEAAHREPEELEACRRKKL